MLEYTYEDFTLEQYGPVPPTRVEAKYIPAKLESMRGNPFYEALPVLKPYSSIDYTVLPQIQPLGPDEDEDLRMEQVLELDDIRIPYSFQKDVLQAFKSVLHRAAKEKMQMVSEGTCTVVANDKEIEQSFSSVTSQRGDVGNGFCLVGFPGSSKTTTIQKVVSMYPKVIKLNFKDGSSTTMCPIVTATCEVNGNLSTVLESIAAGMDTSLGNNTEHYCLKMVKKESSLEAKANAVANLFVVYNVMVLVLDEVQEMVMNNKSSSFRTIAAIVNKSKCGLVTVGTQEALYKLYNEWYTGDRAGDTIDTSVACRDRNLVIAALSVLFNYQWFNEKVELTNDIVNTFIDCTGGSIRKIKSLYISATREYIKAKGNATVDGMFFREIAYRKWHNLQAIIRLKEQEYTLFRARIESSKGAAREALEAQWKDRDAKYAELAAGTQNSDSEPLQNLINEVIKHYEIAGKKVNELDLKDKCMHVYNSNRDKGLTTVALVKKVVSQFNPKKPKSTPSIYDPRSTIINGNFGSV